MYIELSDPSLVLLSVSNLLVLHHYINILPRIVSGPSFYLGQGVPLTRDLAPPSRISDLRRKPDIPAAAGADGAVVAGVIGDDEGHLTVGLEWTAPGGDLDFGKGNLLYSNIYVCVNTLSLDSFIQGEVKQINERK